MDNDKFKYIKLSYQLFAEVDGERQMLEETPSDHPFWMITGFNLTIPLFEKNVEGLATGDLFDFIIPKEEAYGEYVEDRLTEMDKRQFMPNGKLDEKLVYVGAVIPLKNEQGDFFNGQVVEIGDKHVTIDLNHPLAGLDLQFKGQIIESRPATSKEVEQMIVMLSKGCGGCGGGGCDDGCGGCGDGGCGDGCGGCGGR